MQTMLLMTNPKLLCGFLLLLSSCSVKQAYFFSPFNATAPAYHTTPLLVDSVKDALYTSAAFGLGGANDRLIDQIVLVRPSAYASHARENCQFFYGADLMLGSYDVTRYDTSLFNSDPFVNTKLINENSGNKFLGESDSMLALTTLFNSGRGTSGGSELNLHTSMNSAITSDSEISCLIRLLQAFTGVVTL